MAQCKATVVLRDLPTSFPEKLRGIAGDGPIAKDLTRGGDHETRAMRAGFATRWHALTGRDDTRIHKPGVAAVPPRTIRAPDGPCRPGEEPDDWSSVVPPSSDHDPQDS